MLFLQRKSRKSSARDVMYTSAIHVSHFNSVTKSKCKSFCDFEMSTGQTRQQIDRITAVRVFHIPLPLTLTGQVRAKRVYFTHTAEQGHELALAFFFILQCLLVQ